MTSMGATAIGVTVFRNRIYHHSLMILVPFGFRKGKTGNFCYQLRAISCLLINLLNTRDRKKSNLLLLWQHQKKSPKKRVEKSKTQ